MLSGYSWLDFVLGVPCVSGVWGALGSARFACVHLNLLH